MKEFWYFLQTSALPIGICVVLPIMIAWRYYRSADNKVQKTTDIIMKAMENSTTLENIDTDKLMDALRSQKKSAVEILNKRLLRGCIFTLIGIAGLTLSHVWMGASPWDADDNFAVMFFILIIAGLALAIGLAYLITYFLTRQSAKNDK